ncbi:MAG: hypothetical protein LBB72_05670 [Spirochaetaceae bacterium]|nr:hypothetical protein [Spirochaetaceae bacterium]
MRFLKLVRLLIIPLIIFAGAALIYAQEEEEDDEDDKDIYLETDWSSAGAARYSRGDQTFSICLGLVKPLFFIDKQEGYLSTKMNLGGLGSLGYAYFLDSHFFLGAEISGMFASTIGENMYFIVPMGFYGGYQFLLSRFEFPLSLMIGAAPQTFKDFSYFGFFAKSSGAVYFRFNPEWSFGLNTAFWWVPEWTKKTRDGYNGNVKIHGFFWEFKLGARYHF